MNAKPILARRHLGTTLFAAAMAVIVALGLLSAVAGLFQSDGLTSYRFKGGAA